jgi:hypothetical protein
LRPKFTTNTHGIRPEDIASTSFGKTADDTIKRKVGDIDIAAKENLTQYIQRLFEKTLIEIIASYLYRQNYIRKSDAVALGRVLQPLVSYLQDRGYDIVLPETKRLASLLSKVDSRNFLGYEDGPVLW